MKKDYSKNSTTYFHDKKELKALHDPSAAYAAKQQGMYTIKDYYAFSQERRVELIDGILYEFTSPTCPHQAIAGAINTQLSTFIRKKKGKCFSFVSPIGVQLDRDNKTVVQPDVLLICDRSKITFRGIYGAPDFVAEVLSPSTRKKDMIIKLYKYHNAGVREYWLIDPDKKELLVYDFAIEETPIRYTFEDTVPVAVLDNECMVDFKELYEEIRFLYESN